MRYHFRVLFSDDGKFVVQSIEFFHCATSIVRIEDAEQVASRILHRFLSQPRFDYFYSAPREGTFEEIVAQFGFGAVKVFSVPVEPATAFATTLRRLRSHRCLSQEQAARRLGIKNRSAYQRLEDPLRANPTLNTIVRLRKVFPNFNIGSLFASVPATPLAPSHGSDEKLPDLHDNLGGRHMEVTKSSEIGIPPSESSHISDPSER